MYWVIYQLCKQLHVLIIKAWHVQTKYVWSQLLVFKGRIWNYWLLSNYYYLQQHRFQQEDVCIAGYRQSVIWRPWTDDRRVGAFHQLTLLHARSDGNEGHEAAEPQVDPQQGLVEVTGDGVCVVLVHEGEGHGGDGVEKEGGAHDRQVPALVLCRSGQPVSGGIEEREKVSASHPSRCGWLQSQRNTPGAATNSTDISEYILVI